MGMNNRPFSATTLPGHYSSRFRSCDNAFFVCGNTKVRLEKTADEVGINRESVDSITESTVRIDKKKGLREVQALVKLDNISLEQFKNFLYKIESSKESRMAIAGVKIKPFFADPSRIRVELKVSILRLNREGV